MITEIQNSGNGRIIEQAFDKVELDSLTIYKGHFSFQIYCTFQKYLFNSIRIWPDYGTIIDFGQC